MCPYFNELHWCDFLGSPFCSQIIKKNEICDTKLMILLLDLLNRECEMFNLVAFDKNSWDKIS